MSKQPIPGIIHCNLDQLTHECSYNYIQNWYRNKKNFNNIRGIMNTDVLNNFSIDFEFEQSIVILKKLKCLSERETYASHIQFWDACDLIEYNLSDIESLGVHDIICFVVIRNMQRLKSLLSTNMYTVHIIKYVRDWHRDKITQYLNNI